MANDIGGVWRTIGGRRVFIKDGQSLADAMKASGKFKNGKEVEHELNKDTFSRFSKEYEKDKKKHTIDKNDINALNELADSGKDINDYYGLDDIAKDYIKNRRQEMGRNEFTKKADEIHKKTLDEKTRNLEDGKEIHDVFRQMDAKEMEAFAKQNPESIKKMQDYLKSKKTNNEDYEYNLYKQAKENPDSINPMTEWSTDWEDLDKRFKDRYEKENKKSSDKNLLSQIEQETDSYAYKELLDEYNAGKVTTADLEDTLKNLKKFNGDTDDLMTAEQLKGKDREEQKEINKQYLKEQNKLAKEKGLISDYNKTDSRGSMSDDSFIEQARKNGMNDEQIAKEVYKKHNGPESNNTSDNNIKRLLAKQAKEEALAKGDKKRAETFENYEKNFAERVKNDSNFAKEWYEGTKKTENIAKENLERAKRNGASVEDLSNRTKQVHELELETQKAQEHANKMSAKVNTPVSQLSSLKDRYYNANSDREKNQIREYTKSALEAVKEGTTLGLVTKESTAGWTSMGGWHDENTTVKKYTKIGPNKWDTPYGTKTDEDMILTALYNEEPLRDLQEANDIAGIKSMGDKSSFRYYGNDGPNRVTYKNQSTSDVMNNNIRNAYEKYKKKHPGSKINFSKFKDNYKS